MQYFAVMSAVFLTVVGNAVSLECYRCRTPNISECDSTVTCRDGQVCYKNRKYMGQVVFDLGCVDKQNCGEFATLPNGTETMKMDASQTQNCSECCANEKCNRNLCEHKSPSLCVDDESFDCALLNSVFIICKDIHRAKKFCRRFCGLCNVVDGNWSPWSSWSICDVTCDNGFQTRTRSCTDPAPQYGGLNCPGNSTDVKTCDMEECPVHGGWSRWSGWGSCSASCDFGLQRRDRSCSNPHPSRFGDHCYGDSRDDRICLQSPCANGGWTDWGSWSTCSLTCGGGMQSRARTCTSPKPSILGQYCIGDAQQIQTCSSKRCPPAVSAFSVDNPYNFTSTLTFSHVIYQLGGDFNLSIGTYTCSVPGTYHFSVTLVRKRSNTKVDRAQCFLYKSGSSVIRIRVDPTDDDTDKGSAAISQSVVLHLNKGDTVYLSACIGQPSSQLEYWSSFTGFLLYPDN